MKTKIFFILLFLSAAFLSADAQQGQGNQHRKRFNLEEYKQQRNTFLIKEVGLTDDEAKQFLPMSDELMTKKYELNKEVRKEAKVLMSKTTTTQAEYEVLLNKVLDLRIKEAELEKEYYQKFKKVLSAEKLYKYHRAEMKFTKSIVRDNDKPQK